LRTWSGPLTLFRPPLDRHWPVANGRWVSQAREYVFPDNDWSHWAPQIDVQEVPGDHDSMVLEPSVRVLADRLRTCLNTAERTETQSTPEAPVWVPATAAE
jgi:thioesterase domain-containing protein